MADDSIIWTWKMPEGLSIERVSPLMNGGYVPPRPDGPYSFCVEGADSSLWWAVNPSPILARRDRQARSPSPG
jgi:hypothetical protein